MELAKATPDSNDPGIADAAAGFLGGGRIAEGVFPMDEFLRFLQNDRALRIGAGLPKECAGRLPGCLTEQLSDERKQWWADEAERDKRGLLEPDHEVNCQVLSEGIRLLDALNNPADVQLLKSLLEHPAAHSKIFSNATTN